MSGSNMWSGPSRALQFHMEMFEEVDRTARWARDHASKPIHPAALHPTFRQRALLQTSLSGLATAVEGESVALVKDDYSDAFKERNISGTLMSMEHELEILDSGQTFYISHHMSEMVRAIGETMDPEPLFETDLPAPTGVIVFEYPICFFDLDPESGVMDTRIQMPCRAMGWRIVDVYLPNSLEKKRGIEFLMWCDRKSYIDIYQPSIAKLGHDDVGPTGDEIELRFWKTDHTGWSFGTTWKIGEEPATVDGKVVTEDGTIHELTGQHRRWLLAFFRLYWQRILVPQTYQPTKHEKKRGMRMGRPLEDGYIKVVRLRREMEAERHGSKGDGNFFDHQFVVSAHPRRQWFKSLGPARNPDGSFNHDSHRLIWIEAHIKGPITGPLVVGQQVQALVR